MGNRMNYSRPATSISLDRVKKDSSLHHIQGKGSNSLGYRVVAPEAVTVVTDVLAVEPGGEFAVPEPGRTFYMGKPQGKPNRHARHCLRSSLSDPI